jgi:endonuclease YncB( thermonuclease family)
MFARVDTVLGGRRSMPGAARRSASGGVGLGVLVALALVVLLTAGPAGTADRLDGPVRADLVAVVDGDTVDVRAHVWLGQTVETRVRLDGIDTPEHRGDCPAEEAAAAQAADRLGALLAGGPLALHDVRYGTWAGRVVARVHGPDGTDVGAALIAEGLAAAYDGRGDRPDWCALLAASGG